MTDHDSAANDTSARPHADRQDKIANAIENHSTYNMVRFENLEKPSNFLVLSEEPPTLFGCLDILNRTANLADLLHHIDMAQKEDDGHGGLTPGAAQAYTWLTDSMRDTLEYASDALKKVVAQFMDDRNTEHLQNSAFLQAMSKIHAPNQDQVLTIMAAHLGCTQLELAEYIAIAIGEAEL